MNRHASLNRPGDWQMGGSGNPQLWTDFELSEADLIMLLFGGLPQALDKAQHSPERFILELCNGLCADLQDRMGVDLAVEHSGSA